MTNSLKDFALVACLFLGITLTGCATFSQSQNAHPYVDRVWDFSVMLPDMWTYHVKREPGTVGYKVRFHNPADKDFYIQMATSSVPAEGYAFDDLYQDTKQQLALARERMPHGDFPPLQEGEVAGRKAVIQTITVSGKKQKIVAFVNRDVWHLIAFRSASTMTFEENQQTIKSFLDSFTILDEVSASESPAAAATFAWPTSGKVRVTESTVKNGSTKNNPIENGSYGKTAYDLVITQNEQTKELYIDYDNFEIIDAHGLSVDPLMREKQLELSTELTTNLPGFTISEKGILLAAGNIDPVEFTKKMLNSELAKGLDDEESRTKLVNLMQSQKFRQLSQLIKAQVEAEIHNIWYDWVRLWIDMPLSVGGVMETAGEDILFDQVIPFQMTIEQLPVDKPNHENMVKWRALTVWRPSAETMDKVATSKGNQMLDAMEIQPDKRPTLDEPLYESIERMKEVIVITNPNTLQPVSVTVETTTRSHARGRYPQKESEGRQYEFDWR